MTDAVAALSIETGIAPIHLLETPPEVWLAMMEYLERRAKDREQTRRR